jgi:hypothetical protein
MFEAQDVGHIAEQLGHVGVVIYNQDAWHGRKHNTKQNRRQWPAVFSNQAGMRGARQP